MSKKYFLTKKAAIDFENIIKYTLEEWGLNQVSIYQNQLKNRLNAIVTFPDLGRKHPKLTTDIYYVSEGKHYIFYRQCDDGIEILRFLHHQMDIIKHISDEL